VRPLDDFISLVPKKRHKTPDGHGDRDEGRKRGCQQGQERKEGGDAAWPDGRALRETLVHETVEEVFRDGREVVPVDDRVAVRAVGRRGDAL